MQRIYMGWLVGEMNMSTIPGSKSLVGQHLRSAEIFNATW